MHSTTPRRPARLAVLAAMLVVAVAACAPQAPPAAAPAASAAAPTATALSGEAAILATVAAMEPSVIALQPTVAQVGVSRRPTASPELTEYNVSLENFDKPDPKRWGIYSATGYSAGLIDGAYTLRVTRADSDAYILPAFPNSGNYLADVRLDADVRVVFPDKPARYGLVCGVNEPTPGKTTGYILSVSTDGKAIVGFFDQRTKPIYTELDSTDASKQLGADATRAHLRIECTDTHVTLSVNSWPVLKVPAPHPPRGGVGVYVATGPDQNTVAADFDNYRVASLSRMGR